MEFEYAHFYDDVTLGVYPSHSLIAESLKRQIETIAKDLYSLKKRLLAELGESNEERIDERDVEWMKIQLYLALSAKIRSVPIFGKFEPILYCLRVDGVPIVTSSFEVMKNYYEVARCCSERGECYRLNTLDKTHTRISLNEL